MFSSTQHLYKDRCDGQDGYKVCRTRGGESCAFDGAMIVLQPISDAAHIVHGPIACCGNSWQGRGTLSSKGVFHRMGFTTDMNELDIVYGSEGKLYEAIVSVVHTVKPVAVFVYSTCVSGIIGEDMESVCKKAEVELGIRVVPVDAPGFVGPKNLGNRIAGQVLMDYVIGTGTPPYITAYDINLIGEYNVAGDLWLIEPILNQLGIRILSRITGDSTFNEITYAHCARLNVLVCGRALINVARDMERTYGIPYVEVSFYGSTEMRNALTAIAKGLNQPHLIDRANSLIENEEGVLKSRLKDYEGLRGKRAVLYTGGVKSWSLISALIDLGIEVRAVGTKKSTFEDEQKMRSILGEDALLVEDVTPSNLKRLMIEHKCHILVAGGRNLYLAMKEGFAFVDVNQERHNSYAGYQGFINLAKDIYNSIRFFDVENQQVPETIVELGNSPVQINPIKHSQALGAAIAFQGVHRAVPVMHGAQGCTFLAKVLITQHYREPIALISSKLFTEDVVMGSDELLEKALVQAIDKNTPSLIGVLTTGLSEVKGDYLTATIKNVTDRFSNVKVALISTADYEGSLESGYAKAVEGLLNGHRPALKGIETFFSTALAVHFSPHLVVIAPL
ncbi:MAG: nitrogenase iron-molybdenum cofactor biosynthesis protein NifE [Candidatus Magnetoovum sp. WYHC-5]|nr:nitrogenase iron-molybdenum cofactor biosynthesis protein NifE [Candidatus Magnetoovum sp. WYHC-5]